jgi:hypothetical protein
VFEEVRAVGSAEGRSKSKGAYVNGPYELTPRFLRTKSGDLNLIGSNKVVPDSGGVCRSLGFDNNSKVLGFDSLDPSQAK